ncbi:hypothetical protein, partial [Bradyrhizobium uaiense]|uniref:hypothetical protein n=1 Tax=Bradyrhizobium uaiense TaxID=2594946 RepID=UPI0019D625A0
TPNRKRRSEHSKAKYIARTGATAGRAAAPAGLPSGSNDLVALTEVHRALDAAQHAVRGRAIDDVGIC